MPKIIEKKPKTLGELLGHIEEYQVGRSDVWFRGVNKHNHGLTPTIARSKKSKSEADIDDLEKKISSNFLQRSPPFVDKDLNGAWKIMFYMQHYGIPTRLLDWSESPFVSLYFALANAERNKRGKVIDDVALWMCDPIQWNRTSLSHISFQGEILDEASDELKAYSPDLNLEQKATQPIMIYGTHNSPRIVAQRGVFALFGKSMKGMEAVFTEGDYPANCLTKFVISSDHVDGLIESLFQKGFSESTIFPDLMGLSLEIRRRFGF